MHYQGVLINQHTNKKNEVEFPINFDHIDIDPNPRRKFAFDRDRILWNQKCLMLIVCVSKGTLNKLASLFV